MDEKKRQKTILLGIAAAAGIALVAYIADSVILAPVREAETSLRDAAADLEDEKLKEEEFIQAVGRLNKLKGESLPAIPRDAERLYREWLRDLATRNGFSNLVMSESRPDGRKDQWSSVSVPMEGETTLPGLLRFLHQFQQARLAHRLADLQLKSSSSTSSPRMTVIMVAEGLTVEGAPDRAELFPRQNMVTALKADDVTMTVASDDVAGFPEEGEFLVRVENELIKVTSREGTEWTVERGIAGTTPEPHSAVAPVELFPISDEEQGRGFEETYSALVKSNPWLKPAPPRTYSPQIESINTQKLAPGDNFSTTVRVTDLNPEGGDPIFALQDAPEGMTIDPKAGTVTWTTGAETPPNTYTANVVVTQSADSSLQLQKELKVTLQIPNNVPQLDLVASANVYLGRDFQLKVAASDDGPAENLKFSLKGAPAGLTIDAAGVLSWTPPRTFAPGDYDVEVTVTDAAAEPLSSSKSIRLTVGEDAALLTGLTGVFGSIGSDGGDPSAEAWFVNRATNSTIKLVAGDELEVADVHVQITEVDAVARAVRMKDDAGIWLVRLGDSIRDRRLIEPAAVPSEQNTIPAAAGEETIETSLQEKPESADNAEPTAPEAESPAADPDSEKVSPKLEEPVEEPVPASAEDGSAT